MRSLPAADTLSDAVAEVVRSNKKDGYHPNRFIQATMAGHSVDLLLVCVHLIQNAEILEHLEKALRKHPSLLTLEDFVARSGKAWGFSDDVITIAAARAAYFDQLVGERRYQ